MSDFYVIFSIDFSFFWGGGKFLSVVFYQICLFSYCFQNMKGPKGSTPKIFNFNSKPDFMMSSDVHLKRFKIFSKMHYA